MRITRITQLVVLLLASACAGEIREPTAPTPRPMERPELFPPARPLGPAADPDVIPLPPAQAPERTLVSVNSQFQPTFTGLGSTPTPPPALSGGTLRVLRGGARAAAADPDRDRIFVADLAEGRLLREVMLSPGDEPGRVVEDGAGRVHVALRRGGAVVTLAPDSHDLAERRPVCPAPRGLAVAADSQRLYVACAGGELVALPAGSGPPLWTRQLPRDLRDVVVDGQRLLISTFRSARLLVLDLEGQLLDEVAPPTSLNLTRREQSGPAGPATTRFTPSVAWRTVDGPGGGALMLHQRGFTGEVVTDVDSGGRGGGYGGVGCGGSIVQTVVSRVVPGRPHKPSPEIARAVLALDLALSPDGRTLALVAPADAHVTALGSLVLMGPLESATTPNDRGCVEVAFLGSAPAVPGAPRVEPPWLQPQPSRFMPNRLLGQAVAVAFDGQGDVVVQMREPPAIRVPGRQLTIPLSQELRVDVGQAIFHANTGAGIACASCHPEGAEDGRVWQFAGLGARRTQSLLGGVGQTLPLHWDGDMRDVAHIAREVFTGRMAGPQLDGAQATALALYLDGLPLLPRGPARDLSAVERGRAVFNDPAVACASCHAGPRFTDNSTRDVGTGRPLQVPSLLGLGDRAPFMHTGCAATLDARFSMECGGGDRHGATSRLSLPQQADLRAFLESL
jgi:mono/diheme cytochrome c family protein